MAANFCVTQTIPLETAIRESLQARLHRTGEGLYLLRMKFDQEVRRILSFQCFLRSIQGQPFGAFNIHLDQRRHSEAGNVEVECIGGNRVAGRCVLAMAKFENATYATVPKARLVEANRTRSIRYGFTDQADVRHSVKFNILLKHACEQP